MGKASLYYYFPNKESLFRAAILYEQSEFLKNIDSLLKKENRGRKKLKIYFKERLKFFHELLNLGTLSFNALNDRSTISMKLYESFAEKEIRIIKNIIEEGKSKGEFISDIPKYYPDLLIHLIRGLRLRTIRSITGSEMEPKIYQELQDETMMTIDMYIKAIQKK
jgi:TetR/AcrR family transcriptional repressor of mexJK operon